MTELTQEGLDVLKQAVDIIVDRERENCPEQDDDFWKQFRAVLLAAVIERREEILP